MENVTENNKLIAEFMEIPKCDRCGELDCGQYKFGAGMYFHPDFMPYNISWDWLMPVVQKIKDSRTNPMNLALASLHGRLNLALISCEIEATYGVVIKFIKWYNQTK